MSKFESPDSMIKILPLVVLLLTGCASDYSPSNSLVGGFSETRLGPDTVRVTFKGNTSTSKERSQDLALMRAADLAQQAGYPFFRVVDEVVDGLDIAMPRTQLLVQFLKTKPADGVTFEAAYLIQSVKEKYKLK